MRGIRSTWLTTLVVTTVVGTLGLGATARAGTARPVNRGYQHLLQVEAARDAAMAARGARPGSALPTHGGVAGPATLGTVRDVEQISEDTLHQGEKDTQVEPDIAMDPNDANQCCWKPPVMRTKSSCASPTIPPVSTGRLGPGCPTPKAKVVEDCF